MAKNSPIKTFVLQLAKAFFAAVTVILISRWMGAEVRGELGLLLFYVNIIMVLNEYIGGSSLANLAAKYRLSRLLPYAWGWTVLTLLFSSVILYFWLRNIETVFYTLLIAFPLAFLSVQYNLFHGRAEVYRRNIFQLMVEILKLIFIVAIAFSQIYLFTDNLDSINGILSIKSISLVYSLSSFLVLIVASAWLVKKWKNSHEKIYLQKPPAELWKLGFWSQNGQLIQFLNYRFSLVLLAHFLGTTAPAGIYSNALLIADSIWIFGNSFGTIAHMRILQTENSTFQADITLRYTVISIAGTLTAVLMAIIIPQSIYVGIFGADFTELKQTVIWLVPAIIALSASTVFSHYLHALNQFKALLIANLAGLMIQTSLAFWLIPQWGLKGACMAANAGFILILIIVFFLFRKQNPGARVHGVFRLKALWRMLFG